MIYINKNKLNTISIANNNFYVIMDFDETITSCDSSNSWSILENPNFINPNFKKESLKLIQKYYPIELDYSLNNNQKSAYMEEWYIKNMDLLYKYELTNTILVNCVKNSSLKFRNGFKSFIYKLYKQNIPIIILSAGIGNVIAEFLSFNNCLYNNIHIISNFIKFENDKMLPFNDKIIHSSNKHIETLPSNFLDKITYLPYILLFGNLIEDLNMINEQDLNKTISFGFLEKNVDVNLSKYKNSFDIVLTDNSSFNDVENILSSIKEKSN